MLERDEQDKASALKELRVTTGERQRLKEKQITIKALGNCCNRRGWEGMGQRGPDSAWGRKSSQEKGMRRRS